MHKLRKIGEGHYAGHDGIGDFEVFKSVRTVYHTVVHKGLNRWGNHQSAGKRVETDWTLKVDGKIFNGHGTRQGAVAALLDYRDRQRADENRSSGEQVVSPGFR